MLLAVSGGADSLALASAAAFLHRRGEGRFLACTVDHGLQEGSAEVARQTVDLLGELGLPAVSVRLGPLSESAEGIEARARHARYAALACAAREHGCAGAVPERDPSRNGADEAEGRAEEAPDALPPLVLTAHTQDDQAETVLLGLMRGSGARSLAGMAPLAPLPTEAGEIVLVRPLLGVTREQTRASCEAQGLPVWDDPMNEDPEFARVRVRRLLHRLEGELGRGLRGNLARTANLLREDADFLDAEADRVLAELAGDGSELLEGERLAALHPAVRTRVLRRWLLAAGVSAQELTAAHVRRVSELAVPGAKERARVSVPGGLEVRRTRGRFEVRTASP